MGEEQYRYSRKFPIGYGNTFSREGEELHGYSRKFPIGYGNTFSREGGEQYGHSQKRGNIIYKIKGEELKMKKNRRTTFGKRIFILAAMMMLQSSLFVMKSQAQKFALIDMEYILKYVPAYERASDAAGGNGR